MYMQPDLVSNNFTLIKELHTTFFMMLTWKSTSKKWSLTLARLTHFKGFWHSCYRMLNRIGLTYILTYVFDNCKSVTVIVINWNWWNWGQIIICFLFCSLDLTTLEKVQYYLLENEKTFAVERFDGGKKSTQVEFTNWRLKVNLNFY